MNSENLAIIDEDPTTPVPEELLLTDEDFPSNYTNMHHPDDYKLTTQPIEKELIFHQFKMRHPRLILRFSIKLAENVFTSMSFVLDTGAPKVYISAFAKPLLVQHCLLVEDEELGVKYVKFFGREYRTEDTPEGHAPANIIGLKTLCRWGLTLFDEPDCGFLLKNDFSFLEP